MTRCSKHTGICPDFEKVTKHISGLVDETDPAVPLSMFCEPEISDNLDIEDDVIDTASPDVIVLQNDTALKQQSVDMLEWNAGAFHQSVNYTEWLLEELRTTVKAKMSSQFIVSFEGIELAPLYCVLRECLVEIMNEVSLSRSLDLLIANCSLAQLVALINSDPYKELRRARRRVNMVKMILDEIEVADRTARLLITLSSENHWTPLHIACEHDDTETVRVILDSVSDQHRLELSSVLDHLGFTPLHKATQRATVRTVSCLLHSLPRVHILNMFTLEHDGADSHQTLLHCAACNKKDNDVILLLLEYLLKSSHGETKGEVCECLEYQCNIYRQVYKPEVYRICATLLYQFHALMLYQQKMTSPIRPHTDAVISLLLYINLCT